MIALERAIRFRQRFEAGLGDASELFDGRRQVLDGDGATAGLLPPREELAKDLVDELASLEARQPRLFFVFFLEIENVGGVVLERTGEILLGRR